MLRGMGRWRARWEHQGELESQFLPGACAIAIVSFAPGGAAADPGQSSYATGFIPDERAPVLSEMEITIRGGMPSCNHKAKPGTVPEGGPQWPKLNPTRRRRGPSYRYGVKRQFFSRRHTGRAWKVGA